VDRLHPSIQRQQQLVGAQRRGIQRRIAPRALRQPADHPERVERIDPLDLQPRLAHQSVEVAPPVAADVPEAPVELPVEPRMSWDEQSQRPALRQRRRHLGDRAAVVLDVLEHVLAEQEVDRAGAGLERGTPRDRVADDLDAVAPGEPRGQMRRAAGFGLDQEEIVDPGVQQPLGERADAGADLDDAPADQVGELREHPIPEPPRAGEVLEVPDLRQLGAHCGPYPITPAGGPGGAARSVP